MEDFLSHPAGGIYFTPRAFQNQEYEQFFAGTAKKRKGIKVGPLKMHELPEDKKEEYLMQLDYMVYFENFFLRKDVTIKELANETRIGININIISSLIKSEYGFYFNDYINSKRIEYLMENMINPDWKDLSLEQMAEISGFGSRTSCFRAFQKHKGKSPSQYLKVTAQKDKDAVCV